MVSVGIDCGIRDTKAVVLCDGAVCGRACVATDWDPAQAAVDAQREALAQAKRGEDEVDAVVVTGAGKDKVPFGAKLSGINAAALGALAVDPTCRSVIDLGAEGIRAVVIDESGAIGNFAVNDRCASGAGAFLETMARILETPVAELSAMALQRTEDISVDTQCVVFAESEVISLIHQQVPPQNIIHAIHQGLANKISSIALRAGVVEPLVMIGAAAANEDLVACLERKLGKNIMVPDEYEYISASGAAVYGMRGEEDGDGE